ncbi:RNA polymerase sigma-70 factor [Bacteroides sp.]
MHNAQIIKKLNEGDHQAYKFIFDHYYALMGAIAYEYVEDYYVSQNIVEDVMMSIWEKRDQLNISTSIKSYLLTSVRNRCIDHLRSQSREAEIFSIESEIGSSSCYIPDQEMFEQIVLSELETKIEEIIQSMPEECKQVFLLSRYREKSYAEIADELHISVNTVKYHIKKALSLLREELKDYILTVTALYLYLFNH